MLNHALGSTVTTTGILMFGLAALPDLSSDVGLARYPSFGALTVKLGPLALARRHRLEYGGGRLNRAALSYRVLLAVQDSLTSALIWVVAPRGHAVPQLPLSQLLQ